MIKWDRSIRVVSQNGNFNNEFETIEEAIEISHFVHTIPKTPEAILEYITANPQSRLRVLELCRQYAWLDEALVKTLEIAEQS